MLTPTNHKRTQQAGTVAMADRRSSSSISLKTFDDLCKDNVHRTEQHFAVSSRT
uniref:Uncharacterized protein n=1 Tax=Anopheles dirus TaxID=7168 RepID=A0A182NXH2_9DIPT